MGQDYLYTVYGYREWEQNISIIAVFLFWLGYILINCFVMEYLDLSSGLFLT